MLPSRMHQIWRQLDCAQFLQVCKNKQDNEKTEEAQQDFKVYISGIEPRNTGAVFFKFGMQGLPISTAYLVRFGQK